MQELDPRCVEISESTQCIGPLRFVSEGEKEGGTAAREADGGIATVDNSVADLGKLWMEHKRRGFKVVNEASGHR